MLAGLIFATHDADDRREALAATLPFGGATLIEFQSRLLIDAGVSQILVAVGRVTPELLAAVARIARRGVAIDVVRSAAEAAAKAHPLARVVVVADALVTTDAHVTLVAGEGEDLLLVTTRDDEDFERVDGATRWAGLARIGAARIVEAAQLPRDYDFQSSLLRVAVQAGATRLMLGDDSAVAGHGVERDSRHLLKRGKAVFAALAQGRVAWVDRWLFAPLARLTLPHLVARGGSGALTVATGVLVGLGGLGGIASGWPSGGLAAVTVALATSTIGAMLGWLRGEDAAVRWGEWAIVALAALAVCLAGSAHGALGGVLAAAGVIAATLVERTRPLVDRRRWWGSPAAYPIVLLPFAAAGQVVVGLAAVALYATATLAAAIEGARKQP